MSATTKHRSNRIRQTVPANEKDWLYGHMEQDTTYKRHNDATANVWMRAVSCLTRTSEIHHRLKLRELKEIASDRRINLVKRLSDHPHANIRTIATEDSAALT